MEKPLSLPASERLSLCVFLWECVCIDEGMITWWLMSTTGNINMTTHPRGLRCRENSGGWRSLGLTSFHQVEPIDDDSVIGDETSHARVWFLYSQPQTKICIYMSLIKFSYRIKRIYRNESALKEGKSLWQFTSKILYIQKWKEFVQDLFHTCSFCSHSGTKKKYVSSALKEGSISLKRQRLIRPSKWLNFHHSSRNIFFFVLFFLRTMEITT